MKRIIALRIVNIIIMSLTKEENRLTFLMRPNYVLTLNHVNSKINVILATIKLKNYIMIQNLKKNIAIFYLEIKYHINNK